MVNNARLSFRITLGTFKEPKNIHSSYIIDYYIINIKNYLKNKSYEIISYTCGAHLDAESPHIHIHYLVNTGNSHIPKVFIQDWKYKFDTGKVETTLPVIKHEGNNIPFPSLTTQKHKKKINISIKFTPPPIDDELEPYNRFLGYPFKEGIVLRHNLSEDELATLRSQAQGEWNSVKIKKLKEQQKKEASDSEYGKICDIISSANPSDYREALVVVLETIKKDRTEYRDHINPQFLVRSVQKYCYHVGIWGIDEIIEKFA